MTEEFEARSDIAATAEVGDGEEREVDDAADDAVDEAFDGAVIVGASAELDEGQATSDSHLALTLSAISRRLNCDCH